MTRMKTYATGLCVVAALAASPTVASAITAPAPAPAAPAARTVTAAPTAPAPAPAAPARPAAKGPSAQVRTVAPGERVHAGHGVRLWLTEEGKHWSTPGGGENFRSVTDGNLDLTTPGITHQAEGGTKRVFHSGVHYGTEDAARVTLTDETGRTTDAALVELAGEPGWGAWYVTTPAGAATHTVTLLDSAGRVLAQLPGRAS
ncbi:hypothetical protein ACPCAC_19295 [Streptomyces lavendulocolor]|uniref:hypothetical protein n=1 Tax=Streptomyces lavendulocolor TaxID=67316 RepID=UPI003C2DD37B